MILRSVQLNRRKCFNWDHGGVDLKTGLAIGTVRLAALIASGADASPVLQIFCAPPLVKIPLARLVSVKSFLITAFTIGGEPCGCHGVLPY